MKYAKTRWLQLLIYLRKWFIVFNAIIGVITVFKITGYSSDNWIAGFYGLGHTYGLLVLLDDYLTIS